MLAFLCFAQWAQFFNTGALAIWCTIIKLLTLSWQRPFTKNVFDLNLFTNFINDYDDLPLPPKNMMLTRLETHSRNSKSAGLKEQEASKNCWIFESRLHKAV